MGSADTPDALLMSRESCSGVLAAACVSYWEKKGAMDQGAGLIAPTEELLSWFDSATSRRFRRRIGQETGLADGSFCRLLQAAAKVQLAPWTPIARNRFAMWSDAVHWRSHVSGGRRALFEKSPPCD